MIEHSYRADSDLSPSGYAYAETLKDFVIQKYNKSLSERGIDGKSHRLVVCRLPQALVSLNPRDVKIWTSARMRCSHTAWPFLTGSTSSRLNVKIIEKQQMSEINPGAWDGLTPEQVVILSVSLSSGAHARFRSKSIILMNGRGSLTTRMHIELRGQRVTTIFAVGTSCCLMVHTTHVTFSTPRPGTHRTRTREGGFAYHRSRLRHSLHAGLPDRSPRVRDSGY